MMVIKLLSSLGIFGSSRASAFATARSTTFSSSRSSATIRSMTSISKITGLPLGPYPVGVTTVEFVDKSRTDPGDPSEPRRLQTEIWYPAASSENLPKNKFSDFLGGGVIPGSIELANGPRAIGGYRDGLTVAELDASVWINDAVRDAEPAQARDQKKFPLVMFSHGAGAFRPSYIYWTEFLASHGYVVAAPDHPGSARYTQVGGKVIMADGGPRSKYPSMARERPKDMITVLDGIEAMSSDGTAAATDLQRLLASRVDCQNVAITGMSFGGTTTADVLELQDTRIRAAVFKCPAVYDTDRTNRKNRDTPIMVMLGTEDTVIGDKGNTAARDYLDAHNDNALLVEIRRGGHVSFTSCEIYNPEYGNGIGSQCASLTKPGETYRPLDIVQQHGIINTYGLAFLNAHLRPGEQDDAGKQLLLDAAKGNSPFSKEEIIVRSKM